MCEFALGCIQSGSLIIACKRLLRNHHWRGVHLIQCQIWITPTLPTFGQMKLLLERLGLIWIPPPLNFQNFNILKTMFCKLGRSAVYPRYHLGLHLKAINLSAWYVFWRYINYPLLSFCAYSDLAKSAPNHSPPHPL